MYTDDIYVKDTVDKYKEVDPVLMEKISKLVRKKFDDKEWDIARTDDDQDLTTMFIFEYAKTMESMSNGEVSASSVVQKLGERIGRLRYSYFIEEKDSGIEFEGMPITSEEYKEKMTGENQDKSHSFYYKENGEDKTAIALFGDLDEKSDGTHAGVDFTSISDMRQAIFKEFSKVMEMEIAKTADLTKDDLVHEEGDSVFVNANLGENATIDQYKFFVNNIDNILQSNKNVLLRTFSTVELNDKKSPGKPIIHDQLSEGVAEYIAALVIQNVERENRPLQKPRNQDRYDVARSLFESKGIDKAITMFVIDPRSMDRELQESEKDGQSLLSKLGDLIDSAMEGDKSRAALEHIREHGLRTTDPLSDIWMDFKATDPRGNTRSVLGASVLESAKEIAEGRRGMNVSQVSKEVKSGFLDRGMPEHDKGEELE